MRARFLSARLFFAALTGLGAFTLRYSAPRGEASTLVGRPACPAAAAAGPAGRASVRAAAAAAPASRPPSEAAAAGSGPPLGRCRPRGDPPRRWPDRACLDDLADPCLAE